MISCQVVTQRPIDISVKRQKLVWSLVVRPVTPWSENVLNQHGVFKIESNGYLRGHLALHCY